MLTIKIKLFLNPLPGKRKQEMCIINSIGRWRGKHEIKKDNVSFIFIRIQKYPGNQMSISVYKSAFVIILWHVR